MSKRDAYMLNASVLYRDDNASLLANLEQAFGRSIPSREDIDREVGYNVSAVN